MGLCGASQVSELPYKTIISRQPILLDSLLASHHALHSTCEAQPEQPHLAPHPVLLVFTVPLRCSTSLAATASLGR